MSQNQRQYVSFSLLFVLLLLDKCDMSKMRVRNEKKVPMLLTKTTRRRRHVQPISVTCVRA